MKASIVDLRYKMNEVLGALDRCETVQIFYHGKLKAFLTPVKNQTISTKKISDHPAFGLYKHDTKSVEEVMKNLRQERHHDF